MSDHDTIFHARLDPQEYLDGALDDESVDDDILGLADAVGALLGLRVRRRVPVSVCPR